MLAIIATLLLTNPTDTRLELVCRGTATVSTSVTTSGNNYGDPSNSVTSQGTARINERVGVSIDGSSARIRTPSSMLPDWPFRSRSEDGWRPITELVVTDDLITGKVALGPVTRQSLRIDRLTGVLELRGGSPFTGECEPVDHTQRRF